MTDAPKAYRGGMDTISLPMSEKDHAEAKKRVDRLRKANAVLMHDMQSRGAEINFVTGMIHSYFESLVDIGAMDADQWTALQLIWEERFNDQLTTMKATFEKAVQEARNRARLAVPNSGPTKKLIVPGT